MSNETGIFLCAVAIHFLSVFIVYNISERFLSKDFLSGDRAVIPSGIPVDKPVPHPPTHAPSQASRFYSYYPIEGRYRHIATDGTGGCGAPAAAAAATSSTPPFPNFKLVGFL
jgi:hypothetical protein